jgi:hypothetical protein
MPDQQCINTFLASLNETERDVLAAMLSEAFAGGVHETLVVLHEEQIAPFENGYEGTPFHDFVGRLDNWPWPTDPGTANC